MTILFHLPFPGFLRMYGSTISLLAERGHRVLLAYDQPEKRRDPTAAEIEAADGVEIVPPLPRPSRRLEPQIGQLRLAIDYLRYLDPRFEGSPYLRRRLEKYLDGPMKLLKRAPRKLPFTSALVRALVAAERLAATAHLVASARAALGEVDAPLLREVAVVIEPGLARIADALRAAVTEFQAAEDAARGVQSA
jgi:hypothetical protein